MIVISTILKEVVELCIAFFQTHVCEDSPDLQAVISSSFANLCTLHSKVTNHISFCVFIFLLSVCVHFQKSYSNSYCKTLCPGKILDMQAILTANFHIGSENLRNFLYLSVRTWLISYKNIIQALKLIIKLDQYLLSQKQIHNRFLVEKEIIGECVQRTLLELCAFNLVLICPGGWSLKCSKKVGHFIFFHI